MEAEKVTKRVSRTEAKNPGDTLNPASSVEMKTAVLSLIYSDKNLNSKRKRSKKRNIIVVDLFKY